MLMLLTITQFVNGHIEWFLFTGPTNQRLFHRPQLRRLSQNTWKQATV